MAAFCAERGIGVSSFYPWKRRLSGSGDAAGVPASGAPAFVEATVRGVSGERGGVSVELPHGRRVAVARGFYRRLLLEVIEALESGGPGRTPDLRDGSAFRPFQSHINGRVACLFLAWHGAAGGLSIPRVACLWLCTGMTRLSLCSAPQSRSVGFCLRCLRSSFSGPSLSSL